VYTHTTCTRRHARAVQCPRTWHELLQCDGTTLFKLLNLEPGRVTSRHHDHSRSNFNYFRRAALLAMPAVLIAIEKKTHEAFKVDPRDEKTPDNWVKRHPELIRLTGKHPFNCEPPLDTLYAQGFITPPSLHYVRNHGPCNHDLLCPVLILMQNLNHATHHILLTKSCPTI
jgi:hypothetical protein